MESNAIEGVRSEEAISESEEAWEYLKNKDEIDHEAVKKTHGLIMENRQPEIAGRYREEPDEKVWVGNHEGTDPTQVLPEMGRLLQDSPSTHKECLEWHVKFEKIHPFLDGNGRVGRMLYWKQCLDLDVKPHLFTAAKRQSYYKLFQKSAEAPVMTQVE